MLGLLFFANVGPHGAELLGFISGVYVVENGEFGSEEVGKVSDFSIPEIERNQIFVMPDHASEPLVVGPSSESGNCVDGSDVEEEEQKPSSAS